MIKGSGSGWRRWLTAPGWSSWSPMRSRWSPVGRQGWTPSKPPSHAGPKRPTRGSRAIPGPAVRWRWRRGTTTAWKWWAGSPRTVGPWRALTTLWGTGLTGDVRLVPSCALGGRRQASGWGGGVRRHLVAPDPSPMSVKRTSRWIDCIDGRRCLLVLTRPYAEPVTPLGRQRDSAAAASRGPCSQKEQRDPLFAEVERHRQIVANRISCRPWTLPSTLGSSPG